MLFRQLFLFFLFFFSTPCFSDQLIIEPDMGRAPILAAIYHAKSIELVMYGITDPEFIKALEKSRNTKILLEKSPYKAADENNEAVQQFQQNHLNLQWSNPTFKLTHQKTFIFDHKQALIMTFNLTHSTFTKERNFGLLTDNPNIVREISNVFSADWEHQPVRVNHPNLAWCPDNCRKKIQTFIQSAAKTIDVYAQNISDYQITGTLAAAAKSGVKVQLILPEHANRAKNKKRFAYLTRSGVNIHFNHQYYIHAKVIIIDQRAALLGSINFTQASMNENRELSIISTDKNVIDALLKTFKTDWEK